MLGSQLGLLTHLKSFAQLASDSHLRTPTAYGSGAIFCMVSTQVCLNAFAAYMDAQIYTKSDAANADVSARRIRVRPYGFLALLDIDFNMLRYTRLSSVQFLLLKRVRQSSVNNHKFKIRRTSCKRKDS